MKKQIKNKPKSDLNYTEEEVANYQESRKLKGMFSGDKALMDMPESIDGCPTIFIVEQILKAYVDDPNSSPEFNKRVQDFVEICKRRYGFEVSLANMKWSISDLKKGA